MIFYKNIVLYKVKYLTLYGNSILSSMRSIVIHIYRLFLGLFMLSFVLGCGDRGSKLSYPSTVEADSIANLAVKYSAKGRQLGKEYEYEKAAQAYLQASDMALSIGDTLMYLDTRTYAATNLRKDEKYKEASELLYGALDVADSYSQIDSIKGQKQLSYLYNGLGNIYKYLDDGVNAEEFFRKSLEIDRGMENYLGMAKNYSTIGNIYEHRGQVDSAEVLYNLALKYDELAESDYGVGICHNRLGQLMMKQNRFDKALEHYNLAYDFLKKGGDRWNLIKTAMSMAWIYIEQGRWSRAERLLDEAEKLLDGRQSYGHLEEIYYCRGELYRRQGKYRQATEAMAQCLVCRDSMALHRGSSQEVARLRVEYERKLNEKAMDLVNSENKRIKATRNLVVTGASIVTGMLIVVAVLLSLYSRLQRKRNEELHEINDIKTKFFSIISHDLKNPVIAQRKALKMINDCYDNIPSDLLKNQCEELYCSSDALYSLLENLLTWSRLESGRMKPEPIIFNLADGVEEVVSHLSHQASDKGIAIVRRLDTTLFAHTDFNMATTVIRNILSNAIKYSNSNSEVEVSTVGAEDMVKITIRDYGVGMPNRVIESLRTHSQIKSSLGTHGESGTGLGLITSYEMVILCGGSMNIKSAFKQGTTVEIFLPTHKS